MSQVARLAAPNSLLLVLDPGTGELPATLGESSIAATPTGIAIGTLNEFDGEVTVYLASPTDMAADSALDLRWTGTLGTAGRIAILNIYNEVLLEASAPELCDVAIWSDDSEEPTQVWVLFS